MINKNARMLNSIPRIALIIDSENWAFHNCAKQIITHLSQSYEFEIFPSSAYRDLTDLLIEVKEFDLVHFFWRADILRLLQDWVAKSFFEDDLNQFDYLNQIIVEINITTSIFDHLFLSPEEIKEYEILFTGISIGYTTVSQRLYELYSAISDYPKPFSVIEDGIDLNLFAPYNLERLADENRNLVIGWAGNSNWSADGVDHKGINTIIKPAIESLKEEGYNIDGLYADRQERWIPHTQMNDFYNMLDIYVCASDNEGNPDPILESMACGVPVISTDVGIVPQLFGSQQKEYILSERNIDDLKVKLIQLIKDPQNRISLSQENLGKIQNWTWESQSKKWESFFQTMIALSQDEELKKEHVILEKEKLNAFRISSFRKKLVEIQTELKAKDNWSAELQVALASSEERIAEKDKWSAELQTALASSEERITKKDKWSVELQAALASSEERITEKDNWLADLQAALMISEDQIKTLQEKLEQEQQVSQLVISDLKVTEAKLENALNLVKEMEASNFWKTKQLSDKFRKYLSANKGK